jgi:hypothetical protein
MHFVNEIKDFIFEKEKQIEILTSHLFLSYFLCYSSNLNLNLN